MIRKLIICAFCAASLLTQSSCVSDTTETTPLAFAPDIRNAQQQAVLQYQDKLLTDSLVPFLTHSDPTLRYRSALAFASNRDSAAVDNLRKALYDSDTHVREMTAYALGQIGNAQAGNALISAFQAEDSIGQYQTLNANILEAVGKVGDAHALRNISTVKNYTLADTVLILGQAQSIYRFALRGIVLPEGTGRMAELVANNDMPNNIRVMAANYLMRARNIDTAPHQSALTGTFESADDPRIRMCIATAIGKAKTPVALNFLRRKLSSEPDYRVRCNIVRALSNFEYNQAKEVAFQAISDPNLHVGRVAGQYLVANGTRDDALRYRSVSRGQLPWEIKSLLYTASNRHLPHFYNITKTNINNELSDWFRRAKNPYEQAAVIKAIAEDPRNHGVLVEDGFSHEHPAVRTAAVEAMSSIASHPQLEAIYGNNLKNTRQQIAGHFVSAIESGDIAMIAVAANALADPDKGLQDHVAKHMSILEEALIKLEVPREIETYDALAACIAMLKGEEYRRKPPAYNHPIAWEQLTNIPDEVPVEVITSRGTIRLELYADRTPGTVLNFINLAKDRFYHGKNFHRVVPNFVIQGGCPRGDGYGSLDYSIRSELPPLYYDRGGYIGMASAGNHTECTQWFITHSPTPHLDGNYTIFGHVTDGMDVVHEIQIGDEILEVNVLN